MNRYLLKSLKSLFLIFWSIPVWCSPFISADNMRLRSHLVFLTDAGVLASGVTTWPIMWRDVARELSQVDLSSLNEAQRNAVYELRFELRRDRDAVHKQSIALHASNSASAFTSSSASDYEKLSLIKKNDWDGDDIALRLQAQLVKDGDYETNLDGSYLVGAFGNWVFGVGAIDRWWGPGNASSLILSHNARPAPGLIFRTNGEQRFESAWLSWLGPWQFTSFVSQLESNRHISEAKLTGMRFSFRPIDGLELGASRAMMWGGEGRENTLSSFWKSLTASDENNGQGAGNQLGGFDVRYGASISERISGVLYAQLIGEDEAGALPSKYLSMFGVQFGVALEGAYLKAYGEYADTTAGSLNEPQFGAAYGHSTYQSGYRYRGRILGSSFDGDARALSVGAIWVLPEQRSVSFELHRAKLNRAGKSRANSLSPIAKKVTALQLSYEFLLGDSLMKLGYGYIDNPNDLLQARIDEHRLLASFEYRY